MADNAHGTPEVDPSDLAHSQLFWSGFMRATMLSIAAVVALMALMALFLT